MTESGTFQMSTHGLDVGLQTWDDANSDGWADEVFLALTCTVTKLQQLIRIRGDQPTGPGPP